MGVKRLGDFKSYFKSYNRRLLLKNYYAGKINKGKNLYASLLDRLFATLAFTLLIYIITYRIFDSLLVSALLTSLFASLYLALIYLKSRIIRNKKIAEINDQIASKLFMKELSQYKDHDFLLRIKEILERYYNTSFHENASYIDLVGEINGELYAVKCINSPMNTKVTFRDLENFLLEVERQNIKEAIVVTSSYFTDEVKEKVDYLLMDFDHLKEIMKEIGQYPTREEIEDYIISDYNYRKESMKKVLKNNSRNRIFKFILLGFVLYMFSFFVPYKTYYRIISYLSIGSGTAMALFKVVRYIEGAQKKA